MGEKVHILKPYHWSAKGDAIFFPLLFWKSEKSEQLISTCSSSG